VLDPLSGASIDSFFAYGPNYLGGVFIVGGH
jgi:hypothetical protein